MSDPKPFPATRSTELNTGLSVASLVLGLLSLLCFFFITGIPAIITGHIARRRAKKQPEIYGGKGIALAGLILGYLSIPLTVVLVVLAAIVLPELAKHQGGGGGFGGGSSADRCVSNMKQIGLAARIWSNDHNEIFPPDFVSMSNELAVTSVLICPSDKNKNKAIGFAQFDPSQNVTYEYLIPNAKEAEALGQVAFRCPIHGYTGMGDGSVHGKSGKKR